MAEQAVRTERGRLVEMFRQAPAFMAMLRGPDHVFERTNQQYQELIGNRDVLGKPLREALPEAASRVSSEFLTRFIKPVSLSWPTVSASALREFTDSHWKSDTWISCTSRCAKPMTQFPAFWSWAWM